MSDIKVVKTQEETKDVEVTKESRIKNLTSKTGVRIKKYAPRVIVVAIAFGAVQLVGSKIGKRAKIETDDCVPDIDDQEFLSYVASTDEVAD